MSSIDNIRYLAELASKALFELEQSLGSTDSSNPNSDLRQRIYRARIEVNETAYAARKRYER